MNLRRLRLKSVLKAFVPYGFIWWLEERQRAFRFVLSNEPLPFVFGQDGEDLLLRAFLDACDGHVGYYVDVGAYHPTKFSNTHYFYQRGWSGINIDANPHAIACFKDCRPRDVNVESGVSDKPGELEYFSFGAASPMNSFDADHARTMARRHGAQIKEVRSVRVRPINEILAEYLPASQRISFMSIDVEGYDERIIRSLDFDLYAPDFFLIEDLRNARRGVSAVARTPIARFLLGHGYLPVGCTNITVLYQRLMSGRHV